jgi:UDP-N-acetyl-D-glucosamine/UDP-N-acetyl-D-galactosamine dehydrogenase
MEQQTLCIVGLGYVGLPLAHAFAKHGYTVHGFDISERRIMELKEGHDRTNELSKEELTSAPIAFSNDPSVIGLAQIIIIALPTPVDDDNKPDLAILEAGTKTVGQHLKAGSIVVYESTVYPGVTEEICGPILERESGLVCGKDFTLGYSPERINPGDKLHTVETIIKIVAGQDEQTSNTLVDVYGSIVKAGIHRAPSIKVAEMAKAIENAQRDINIAYINEVAMLCTKLGIRSKDVLEAAGTKWNFLKFQPGLVGGHCIGVDPFYLVEKAKDLGMTTHIISAGRSINDGMAAFVADQVSGALTVPPDGSRLLVLGLTFKEDVPDTRNSKVHDVIAALKARGVDVEAHDPFLTEAALEAMQLKGGSLENGPYDAVLVLVPHKQYRDTSSEVFINALKPEGVLYDLKSIVDAKAIEEAGRTYVSL